jgi:hypothetical protein
MNRVPERRMVEHPDPEKVAYRYFPLNGSDAGPRLWRTRHRTIASSVSSIRAISQRPCQCFLQSLNRAIPTHPRGRAPSRA